MAQFDQAVKAADKEDQISSELVNRDAYRHGLTIAQVIAERIEFRQFHLGYRVSIHAVY
jgi:hypothetical protein